MSIYFNQSNSSAIQALRGPTNPNLILNNNFTIEFYIKCGPPAPAQDYNRTIFCQHHGWAGAANSFMIYVAGSIYIGDAYGSRQLHGSVQIINNQWKHIAIVRNGMGTNNISLFVNGVLDVQITRTGPWDYSGVNGFTIGANYADGATIRSAYHGYLSNLRIVNGTALYTSNFVPPTTTLTNIAGTALLLFTDPDDIFKDSSSNNLTITKYGQPTPSIDTPVTIIFPCFKEDSKIMCFCDGEEKEMFVQDMRPGVLVKTLLDGYVPVDMIGTTKLFNPGNCERFAERLYLLSKDKYPELNEDLVLTGAHSILVDELTEIQREKTISRLDNLYSTDCKYRLMAEFDERAVPYEVEGEFNIYHFALENDEYLCNYGVFANGLLVETCSKRYLREKSNMRLL
jgi:hypothetical protein